MIVLAFDTSTPSTGIALVKDDVVIALHTIRQERTRAEGLLPTVQALLLESKLQMKDVDVFAVAVGPGSFTGLRIGVTVAKTLAQFLDKKLIGISTLRAMSSVSIHDTLLLPVIDARANRIFAAGYRYAEGELTCVIPEDLYYEEDFIEIARRENGLTKPLLIGEGVRQHQQLIEGIGASVAGPLFNMSPAVQIATLAKEKALRGEFDDPLDLSPQYLRKSQAEMDYGRKHGTSHS